jgi:UrcA family protein
MNTKLITLVALSPFALALVSTPASAQDSRTVSYGDLDLSSQAGIAQLDRRIENAIQSVCDSGDPTLRAKMAERRCRASASADVSGPREMAIAGSGKVLVLNTARTPRLGR